MLFVESPHFTRFCDEHCGDDELRELQARLIEQPDAGDLIRGAKGLRNLRWALPGRGQRGGARVIYYWRTSAGTIYLLCAYAKSRQSDLSEAHRKMLVAWIQEVMSDE
jgi:putative component of toxin-antitoxin plasmid stabilization module